MHKIQPFCERWLCEILKTPKNRESLRGSHKFTRIMVGVFPLFASVVVCHASTTSNEKTVQEDFVSGNDPPSFAKESEIPQHLLFQPSSEQLPYHLPSSQQSLFQRLSGQQTQLPYPPPQQLHVQQFPSQPPSLKRQLPAHISNVVTQTVPTTDASNVLTITTGEKIEHSQSHSGTSGSTRAALIGVSVVMVSTFVFVVIAVKTQLIHWIVRVLRHVVLGVNDRRTPVTAWPRGWVRKEMAPEQTPPPPSQTTEQAPQSPEQASQLPLVTGASPEQASQLPVLATHAPPQDVQVPTQTTQSPDQTAQSQEE